MNRHILLIPNNLSKLTIFTIFYFRQILNLLDLIRLLRQYFYKNYRNSLSTNLMESQARNGKGDTEQVIVASNKRFPDFPIRILVSGASNHSLQDEITHQPLAGFEAQHLVLIDSLGPGRNMAADAVLDDWQVVPQSGER